MHLFISLHFFKLPTIYMLPVSSTVLLCYCKNMCMTVWHINNCPDKRTLFRGSQISSAPDRGTCSITSPFSHTALTTILLLPLHPLRRSFSLPALSNLFNYTLLPVAAQASFVPHSWGSFCPVPSSRPCLLLLGCCAFSWRG